VLTWKAREKSVPVTLEWSGTAKGAWLAAELTRCGKPDRQSLDAGHGGRVDVRAIRENEPVVVRVR